jgi:restriction system protein
MTGIEYEHFVAQHYRADGYKNVFVTKGSGDFGADIILYDKQTNTQKFCIQCKKSSSPVGVKAVQEVLGAREYYKCNGALVITTSTFTEAAKEMAGKTGVALVEKFTSSKYFPPPKRKKRKKKNTNKKDNLDWIDQIEDYHAFMDD